MKKNIVFSVALVAVASLGLTSCDKSTPKMDQKAEATQQAPSTDKIAYVEVDSIMTQYNFCKEYSKILEQKGNNIQKTLANKQQTLQAAAANFQQKVQQNAYTREQAEAIQAGLQKQSNDLQALNQRLSGEFQTETEKYNKALHDSLQNYLAIYNKDKKYSLIFAKQGDNLLYADKRNDITNEVVAGLNKAYKGKAAIKK
ncbi:MAG: OmpH family outer membrane protein [Prevotella sp.]|nr:OmpH family outer membrane protein [Prevotella sp.]